MTYRNKTNFELVIPGVGVVAPGGTIETDRKLENQNLELVTTSQPVQPQAPSQPAAQNPAPQAANGAGGGGVNGVAGGSANGQGGTN